MADDRPPRLARGMLTRFGLAGMAIVLLVAGATAASVLLYLAGLNDDFRPVPGDPRLPSVDPGEPQTLLLLGSDRRAKDTLPARSDTMILVRLDADHGVSVLSVPRDLEVAIPGHGRGRVNAAYARGGAVLAERTVRGLLESTGRSVPVHHIVDVGFGGFAQAVDRLGCVYADVDRRYFNDNDPPYLSGSRYAAIDLKPGYQRLCGEAALSFVRFRHLDDDLVRAARQQSFLRDARAQIDAGRLLAERDELLEILGRNTRTDLADASPAQLLALVKLAYEAGREPTRQVPFPARPGAGGTLAVDRDQLDAAVRRFLEPATGAVRPRGGSAPAPPRQPAPAAGVVEAIQEGTQRATALTARLPGLPVYFPGARLATGGYVDTTPVAGETLPRAYDLLDGDRRRHRAYRIVLAQGDAGQFYGVQGTTWRSPPILRDPTDTVRLGARTFQRHFDGSRIRLIAWRPRDGRRAYWVTNTLSNRLSNAQMMAIAGSLTRIEG